MKPFKIIKVRLLENGIETACSNHWTITVNFVFRPFFKVFGVLNQFDYKIEVLE